MSDKPFHSKALIWAALAAAREEEKIFGNVAFLFNLCQPNGKTLATPVAPR